MMKVILKESVADLGKRGDVLEVASGYARNYLIPYDMAALASKENIRRVEEERREYLARESRKLEDSQEIAVAVEKLQISIPMRAGDDGHLFGSVTQRMIADAMAEEKVTVEPGMVHLEEPIRDLGVYTVAIRLHADVEAELRLWIVEDK